MSPSAQADEIKQMHLRKVAIETEKIQVEKEIVVQLKDLNATLRVLATVLSNKVATA